MWADSKRVNRGHGAREPRDPLRLVGRSYRLILALALPVATHGPRRRKLVWWNISSIKASRRGQLLATWVGTYVIGMQQCSPLMRKDQCCPTSSGLEEKLSLCNTSRE